MDKQFLSIEEMTEKLNQFGNKNIWLKIEIMKNWKERIVYRDLFFKAGGCLDE